MSLSETVRQATVNENYNFEKVIDEVAEGLKQCGFFDQNEWKNMLVQCFGRTKLNLSSQEARIYTSVLTCNSFDAAFDSGLSAESTPYIANQGTRLPTRNKRSSTTVYESTPRDGRKKMKKGSMPNDKVANILFEVKNTDWGNIVPNVTAQQQTVKYATTFDQYKRLKLADTTTPNNCTDMGVTSPTIGELSKIEGVEATNRSRIVKRRMCVYTRSAKENESSKARRAAASVSKVNAASASKPDAASVSKANAASASKADAASVSKAAAATVTCNPTVGDVASTVPESNPVAVTTNIPVRRMTRRQTLLNAAYSGNTVDRSTERRLTKYFQRTSVLFTMIDVLPFRTVLNTHNIFVADLNEKYDYVVAERICCSPKFLSAVVSGKPIVSMEWIHALKDQNVWLEPLDYLLKDDNGEREYNFQLTTTLQLATNRKLFANHSILAKPNISISADMMKGIVFSGGGKFCKTTLVARKDDEVICISDEVDKKMWPRLHKKYPKLKKIISLDGFKKMIFQFTCDVSSVDVLHQF